MTAATELKFMGDLIAFQAGRLGSKTYIMFEDRQISFEGFNQMSLKVVNGLAAQGASPGDGVALLMENCPEYMYLFYGLPRRGGYSVPINTALKGDGLRYILTHSDVKYLMVDDRLYPKVAALGLPLGGIQKVFVRPTGDNRVPEGMDSLDTLLEAPADLPEYAIQSGDISHIMYTSGTTGFPKGAVSCNIEGEAQSLYDRAGLIFTPDDVLYTSLPLFHANALLVTGGYALAAGIPFGLDRKFSASRFWDRIRFYDATQFNTIGAMIPILMKQPVRPDDVDNPVRLVVSSACPANLWEAFEKRFNLTIWEAYGAVDGGAVDAINTGAAPVGSVGKPRDGIEWQLIDDAGNSVPQGEVGELISKVGPGGTREVEYYKDPKAGRRKVKKGWIHSGDLFYADKDKNLYFVDRKTDSIRRRGENISSWEVENIIRKHEHVEEAAAFGVPSEFGEDEVMVWVQSKNGTALDISGLITFCAENMAHFMVPRYVDVVKNLQKTGTLRVQKTQMKLQGVTAQTWDRDKEMPDLKLT